MLNLFDHILKQGNVFLLLLVPKLQNKIKIIKSALTLNNKYYPNQVSKNPSIRLKILTYESPMQSYIKTERNSGRSNLNVRNQYLLSSSEL